MLIIFGLTSRAHLLATISMVCERCGNVGAHQLTKHTRRISVFFVPLIPLGARYEDVCTVCGRTLEVTREQAERATAGPSSLR